MIKLGFKEITPTIFPDKTSQVWNIKIPKDKISVITWNFESENELIHVMQLNDLLKSHNKTVRLAMPYLPYARQDKPINNENTFALETFAKIINAGEFEVVFVEDVHSSKAKDLIKNLFNSDPITDILTAKNLLKASTLAFPDVGAKERYLNNVLKEWSKNPNIIIGNKVRNQKTGYIEKYDYNRLNWKEDEGLEKPILIIDDICDGGMTFKLLAEQLIKDGAKDVNLYITHGIFSKGIQTLRDSGIKRIFTRKGEIE